MLYDTVWTLNSTNSMSYIELNKLPYHTTQHTDIVLSTMTLLVDFTPSKTPYNPRHMLGGTTQPDGTYVSGFFDKGTFKEYLGAYVLLTVQHSLSHSLFSPFFFSSIPIFSLLYPSFLLFSSIPSCLSENINLLFLSLWLSPFDILFIITSCLHIHTRTHTHTLTHSLLVNKSRWLG